MPKLPPKKSDNRPVEQYSRGKVGNFYQSAAWIKLRNQKRILNPLCEYCLKEGKVVGMEIVDHIKPISEGGDPLHLSNLQSLCDKCHRIKTAKETHKRNK